MSCFSPKEIRDLVQTKLALQCPHCQGYLAARCIFWSWAETAETDVHMLPFFGKRIDDVYYQLCDLCGERVTLQWPDGPCGGCVLVVAEEAEEEFRNECAEEAVA